MMMDMTTTTLTLADFLLARIAEDENGPSIVRRVVPAPVHERTGRTVRDVHQDMDLWKARVLAECDAKRHIVEKFKRYEDLDVSEAEADALYGVLRLLAEPYADHPDYDDEWRP